MIRTEVLAMAMGVEAASNNLPAWTDYGILGLLFVATFATKLIVPGWAYSAKEKEIEALREENKTLVNLNLSTMEKVLPALEAGTAALKASQEEMRDMRRQERS